MNMSELSLAAQEIADKVTRALEVQAYGAWNFL